MDQPSLFDYNKEPEPPRPMPLDGIRRTLQGNLWLLRRAITLPWNTVTAEHWEKRFPELCALFPKEEGDAMLEEFRREMERVWAEYHKYEPRHAAG
jgi:hypothetical protein